jgi:glutamate-1-semialdehyde aminotransferase
VNWDFVQSAAWSFFIGGGAGLAIVAFLAKRLVEQALTARMERYKAELTQRSESLKTEMSIYAHEHTVALTRVDAQRAQAIERVYAAMCAWTTPAIALVSGTPLADPDEGDTWRHSCEQAESAHDAGKRLSALLVQHAIYLDTATYEKLATTTAQSTRMIADFLRIIRQAQAYGMEEETAPQLEAERLKLAKQFERRITPLHQEVVGEFRRLLGVERSSEAI